MVAEHPLQSGWSFWYDKKLTKSEYAAVKKENPNFRYQDNLKQLGTFHTVEGFWRNYVHLQRPTALEGDMNLYMFRENEVPMWESYPAGGCWILKVKKGQGVLGKLWQDLLFGAIGELFEEPGVVGVAVATRSKVDMISVWNRDNRNPQVRFSVGEKLKRILGLDTRTVIEYKFHQKSIADKSTYSNAETFVFAGKEDDASSHHSQQSGRKPRTQSNASRKSKKGSSNKSKGKGKH